jgi:hypothetical protein
MRDAVDRVRRRYLQQEQEAADRAQARQARSVIKPFVAFMGATSYHFRIGRILARVLRPNLWSARNLFQFVSFRVDRT